VRLVLCDDHRLFAEPVAVALEERGHQVVVTSSPAEALRAVAEDEPDVCLMDLRFREGDGDGIDAVIELRRRHPLCPVVVLSGTADAHVVQAALDAGAAGFVRKDQPLNAVFAAVDRVAAGREPTPPPPLTDVRPHHDGGVRQLIGGLTSREREVLRCLARAEDTVAIARSLGVAPSTARSHLQSMLHKLGVNSRLQAVALVAHAGVDVEW
jgi:DNA-binding NarL/FixJ family response regulator